MDDADRAQSLEESTRLAGVRRVTQSIKEKPLVIDGQRVCRSCEEEIEEQRLMITPDAVRCVYCQSIYEKERRR